MDADTVKPIVNWYKNSKLVKNVRSQVVIYDKIKSSEMLQSVLLLDTVRHTDSGEYTCRACNDPGLNIYTGANTLLVVECMCILATVQCTSLFYFA